MACRHRRLYVQPWRGSAPDIDAPTADQPNGLFERCTGTAPVDLGGGKILPGLVARREVEVSILFPCLFRNREN